MEYQINQTRQFYLVANEGSQPYTEVDSTNCYFAFVPITPGMSYDFTLTTADIRCRAATFAAEPTSAGAYGLRTVCPPQTNPSVGFSFYFTAAENENVLVIYGGVSGDGATGRGVFELEETSDPHAYNSVDAIIAAGTKHMTALIKGGSYDDNTYTINDPPAWLKYCGAGSSQITVSGNTWFGITTTGEQIKFNRRDTKMTDLYREDGTLYDYYHFCKLRWGGYSRYNQSGSSYRQEWEIIFVDNGSFMIYAAVIPTTYYDGTFEAAGMTYTKPTVETPYVSFYPLDEEYTEYEIRYEILDVPLPYSRKYLISDGDGKYYTVVTEDDVQRLEEIEVTELTPEVFEESGFDKKPTGTLLSTLANPSVLFWHDSDDEPPVLHINLTALPPVQTVITENVQMLDGTIVGIERVEIDADDAVLFAVSFDGGTTWKGYVNDEWVTLTEALSGVSKNALESVGADAWAEQCVNRTYMFRFILFENCCVNSIVIHYIN